MIKKYFLKNGLMLLLLLISSFAFAATKIWDGGGDGINWSSANNWNNNGVPVAGDDIIIPNGFTVTVNGNYACKSVTFNGASATLTVNQGVTLTVSGVVTLNSIVNSNSGATITGLGTLSAATFNVGSDVTATTGTSTYLSTLNSTISNLNVTGDINILSYIGSNVTRRNNATFNLQSGTVNVDGQIKTTNQNAVNISTFSMASGLQSGTLLLGNASPFNLTSIGTNTINLNGTSGTVNYDGATQVVYNTTYNNLIFSGSGNKNSTKAFAVTNNLTVNQGNLVLTGTDANYTVENNLTVAAAGTLTHNVAWNAYAKLLLVSGNVDIAGAYSYSGAYTGTESPRAHIQMNGAGKTIKTGNTALSILTIANTSGTISANGAVTVNDNFWAAYYTGGTFETGINTIIANGALLVAVGNLNVNGGTVNVTNGLYLGYSGGAPVTHWSGASTFSSGSITADFVNIGVAGNDKVHTLTQSGGTANIGNLTIDGSGANSYICTNSPIINISGTWTNNKTFTAANSTVNFTGTSAQTINGTLSGTTGKFYNLTFNGVGGSWTNNAPMDVANKLTMTNGILTTSTTNLLNVTNSAIAAISGGSATSFINGPVKWTTPLSATYNFPVGKGSTYLPFALNTNTTTGTTAQVEAFDTNCGGSADLSTIGTLSTTEYWSLVTIGTFTNSSVSLSRPTAIAPLDIIGGSTVVNGNGANAYKSLAGTAGTNGITNSFAIGTNRFFAFGRREIRTSAITGSPFCLGSTGVAVSVPFTIAGTYNAGNVFTAQLSDASGSFASPVNIGTLTATSAGTISATIPVGTLAGTGYRIRVVSSNPNVVGSDNGSNLTINTAPTITTQPSAPAATCSGSGTQTMTVVATGTGLTYDWKLNGTSVANGGVVSGQGTATLTLTNPTAANAGSYTVLVKGTCNATGVTSSAVTVTVTDKPTIAAITTPAALCAGSSFNPAAPSVTANGSTVSSQGWEISTASGGSTYTALGIPYTVAFADNGKNIRYTATNSCGITTSNVVVLTVNNKPTIASITAPAALCAGGSLNPTLPTVTSNGSAVTAQGWQLETGVGSGSFVNLSVPYAVSFADDGKMLQYYVTNGCGTTTSNQVTLTVTDKPTVAAIATPTALCAGGSLNPTTPSVTSNGSAVTAQGWQLETGVGSGSFANLTVPYTVTFADNGKKLQYYATNGCGTITSNQVTLTVTDKPTVAAIATPTALCAGGSLNPTTPTVTANGSAVTAQGWQLETGVGSGSFANLTVPYTVTFADNGKMLQYYATNGCGTTISNSVTVTVNALPTAAVTSNTQICKNANAVFALTGTAGATVTYNINGINQTTVVLDGSGKATVTVSSAAADQTLNIVSVSNGTCSNSAASSETVKVGEDSVYTGTVPTGSWSKGRPDGNGLNAVIAGNYNTSDGNINACNCTVNGSLTVAKDTSIEIQNSFVNNGTVTVESDGNFKQVNDVPNPPNSGAMTVKRNVKFRNDNRQEYNYLISPVIGQSLKTIYPGVPTTATYPYVLYYNEANNYFYNSSGAYIAGRGLAVKEPSKADAPADNMDAVFNGLPGNGVISFPLAHTNNVQNGYNLVGNPYPSNIDLQKLYLLNGGATASPKISSTFQFWDNGANNIYTQQGSGYSGRAYAVYNAANNTGNAAGYLLSPSQILTAKVPNETAKVGQGFMVRATGGGNLVFNNDIRSNNTGAGFFSKGTQSPADRYWLKLVTPVNAVNTIAVVYFAGGSNAFGMDDSGMNGDSSDMLYSLAEGNKLQIEGKPMFEVSDKIILGSRHFAAGNYTFALDKAEGVFANGQHIYLKDKQTGIITNLSEGSYTFAANAGESTGRFEIIYQSETVLATDGTVKDDLFVYRDGDDFVIDSKGKKITQVEVYDSSGRLSLKTEPGSLKAVIPAISLSNGVYILKINQAGKITNRKIIR